MESSLSLFSEARNEYLKQLATWLVPPLVDCHRKAWDAALAEAGPARAMVAFQDALSVVPKWNQDVIDEHVSKLIDASRCDYLEELVTAVVIAHTKLLTAVRVSPKQKRLQITLPKLDHFLHRVFVECARTFWKVAFLFAPDANGTPVERQKNLLQLEALCCDAIAAAVRSLLPIKSILREYLSEEDEGRRGAAGDEQEEEEELEEDEEEEGRRRRTKGRGGGGRKTVVPSSSRRHEEGRGSFDSDEGEEQQPPRKASVVPSPVDPPSQASPVYVAPVPVPVPAPVPAPAPEAVAVVPVPVPEAVAVVLPVPVAMPVAIMPVAMPEAMLEVMLDAMPEAAAVQPPQRADVTPLEPAARVRVPPPPPPHPAFLHVERHPELPGSAPEEAPMWSMAAPGVEIAETTATDAADRVRFSAYDTVYDERAGGVAQIRFAPKEPLRFEEQDTVSRSREDGPLIELPDEGVTGDALDDFEEL